ncbi:MAG: mechanosensitive ion channel family protein [Chthoniobacterales bacterium]
MTAPWISAHSTALFVVAAIVLLAWFVSWGLQAFLSARLRRLAESGAKVLHIEVLRLFVPLVRWAFIFAAVSVAVRLFHLPSVPQRLIDIVLQGAFTLRVALAVSAAARVALTQWSRAPRDAAEARTRATLAPVLGRSCQVFFLGIAALLILQNAGYNVAGLLAGLGIGGLAVALAAKETLANLFGSIAVLMDRTFQVGDKIKQGDITGVVERIGLRSTRVRTDEGYLVSIPNQLITNAPVTNMGPQKPSS